MQLEPLMLPRWASDTRTATSGADGRFSLERLAPGVARIELITNPRTHVSDRRHVRVEPARVQLVDHETAIEVRDLDDELSRPEAVQPERRTYASIPRPRATPS